MTHKQAMVLSDYGGFEQGPIRPPSEVASLLVRVTRNCPWNRCTFCPVYKNAAFSRRPTAHVLKDIDAVHQALCFLREQQAARGKIYPDTVQKFLNEDGADRQALNAAWQWLSNGMQAIFLQDANSLIINPSQLLIILQHLRRRFPWLRRITSYARSQTLARLSDTDMASLAAAGLTRLHVGMESGSDLVLARVRKGSDKATHIAAGQKVKRAGIELSEYVMPGLGGREMSREHALETADALNHIDADFIRLRTLAVPSHIPLHDEVQAGSFTVLTDQECAEELLLFLQQLEGINSHLHSDHILNLFQDVEGRYPDAKKHLCQTVASFLNLPAKEKMLYQVGRCLGLLTGVGDLADPVRRCQIEEYCQRLGITPDTVDRITSQLRQRFI